MWKILKRFHSLVCVISVFALGLLVMPHMHLDHPTPEHDCQVCVVKKSTQAIADDLPQNAFLVLHFVSTLTLEEDHPSQVPQLFIRSPRAPPVLV